MSAVELTGSNPQNMLLSTEFYLPEITWLSNCSVEADFVLFFLWFKTLSVMHCDEKRTISGSPVKPVGGAPGLMISLLYILHGVDVTLQRQRDCHVKDERRAMHSSGQKEKRKQVHHSCAASEAPFVRPAIESRPSVECKTPCNLQCSMVCYAMQMQRPENCCAPPRPWDSWSEFAAFSDSLLVIFGRRKVVKAPTIPRLSPVSSSFFLFFLTNKQSKTFIELQICLDHLAVFISSHHLLYYISLQLPLPIAKQSIALHLVWKLFLLFPQETQFGPNYPLFLASKKIVLFCPLEIQFSQSTTGKPGLAFLLLLKWK